jgi:hypothetical protein
MNNLIRLTWSVNELPYSAALVCYLNTLLCCLGLLFEYLIMLPWSVI